jgi:hypothetical protein
MAQAERVRPRVVSARGRCYELAMTTLFRMPYPDRWTLVHGQVNGPPDVSARVDYEWLEHGNLCL